MRYLFFILILVSGELFSQAIGPWTQKAQFPGPGRHRAFGFALGGHLYIGGGWNSAQLFGDFWQYDPSTNSWTQKAPLPTGFALASTGFSIGNKGYYTLGLDISFNDIYDLWIYDPVTNSWSTGPLFPGTGGWGVENFVINNKAYIADPGSSDLCIFDPSTNSWSTVISSLNIWADEVGLSAGGFGYMATAGSGTALWRYNASTNAWTQLPSMPSIVGGLTESSGFAIGTKLYVGTGQSLSTGDRTDLFWEFNTQTNTWKYINPLPGMERDDAVGLSLNGKGYLLTGTNGNNMNDVWEFEPSLATGVEEVNTGSIHVFPNPVTDKAIISISELRSCGFAGELRFKLYSLSGDVVYNDNITGDELIFSRNELKGGLYVYTIEGGALIKSGKIVLK